LEEGWPLSAWKLVEVEEQEEHKTFSANPAPFKKASEKEPIALSLYIKQLILFVNLLLYDAKLSMVRPRSIMLLDYSNAICFMSHVVNF
jgi:hypothetical protein